jgi:hypothetical protein
MHVAGNCTHHDHSKDLLVVLHIGPKKRAQLVQKQSSSCTSCPAVGILMTLRMQLRTWVRSIAETDALWKHDTPL